MTTDGNLGEVPDWYYMIRAAKYLGVAPWDLLAQPITWFHWAVAAEQAENQAEAQRQESAKRKAKARGLG